MRFTTFTAFYVLEVFVSRGTGPIHHAQPPHILPLEQVSASGAAGSQRLVCRDYRVKP